MIEASLMAARLEVCVVEQLLVGHSRHIDVHSHCERSRSDILVWGDGRQRLSGDVFHGSFLASPAEGCDAPGGQLTSGGTFETTANFSQGTFELQCQATEFPEEFIGRILRYPSVTRIVVHQVQDFVQSTVTGFHRMPFLAYEMYIIDIEVKRHPPTITSLNQS